MPRRCLEKRCEDRFHSAHDLGLALEMLSSTTVTGTSPAAHGPVVAVPRRRALLVGAASVALLGSGLGAGMFLDRRLRPTVAPSFCRLTFRRGVVRSARFAPDGKTILYGALWDGDRCRVHTVRLESPESRPLDLPEANVLAISRSGEVALSLGAHLEGIVTYGTLARMPIAGGAPRRILEDVKFADWSPDGSDLAIVRRVDGRDRLEFPIGKILVEPAAGAGTGLGFARVSPDGTRVAFVHYRAPGSLVGKVEIVDQTGTVTPLSNEYLNVHGLAWKGDEIWYTAADERPSFRALCAVTPSGTRRVITRTPGNATLWDVSSDGRVVMAHTDDRGVVVAHLPDEVNDRDLSWLDSSLAAGIQRAVEKPQPGQPAGWLPLPYMLPPVNPTALLYGLGCVLCLASADFFLKLSSTRISGSLGTLVYAVTAAVLAAVWVAWSVRIGAPLSVTRSGVLVSMAVGASFMLVVTCLTGLFAAGANLSVAVPAVRLIGIVLAALLGIVVLGEPITWRYGIGVLLTFTGIYFIVIR